MSRLQLTPVLYKAGSLFTLAPLLVGVACKGSLEGESSPSNNSSNAPVGDPSALSSDAGTASGSGSPGAGGAGNELGVLDGGTPGSAGSSAEIDAGPQAPVMPVEPRPPPPVGDCVEFAANFAVQCEGTAPGAITEETCARDYLHYQGLGCRTSWNLFVACASYTTVDCITLAADSCETQHAAYAGCQQEFETRTSCERRVDSDPSCPQEIPYAFSCTGAAWAGCVVTGELQCCPPPDPYAPTPDAGP